MTSLETPRWGRTAPVPERLHAVGGAKVSEQDLVRIGELLEAERELGTARAAKLFQPGVGGAYNWGPSGEGNVHIPLWDGRTVDIDWLNTLISVGATRPDTTAPIYLAAKLGWALAHGVFARSFAITARHLKGLHSGDERTAIELAREFGPGTWTFAEILHPSLVAVASPFLAHVRSSKAPTVAPAPPSAKPLSPPQGSWLRPWDPRHPVNVARATAQAAFNRGSRAGQEASRLAIERSQQLGRDAMQRASEQAMRDARQREVLNRLPGHGSPLGRGPAASPINPGHGFLPRGHPGGPGAPSGPPHGSPPGGRHAAHHEPGFKGSHGTYMTFKNHDVGRDGQVLPGPFRGIEINRKRY